MVCLLLVLLLVSVDALIPHYVRLIKNVLNSPKSALQMSSIAPVTVSSWSSRSRESDLRKWFLCKHRLRADSVYVVDDATTLIEAQAEAWRGVMVSMRVMEIDDEIREHVSIFEFPSLAKAEMNVARFEKNMDVLSASLNRTVSIFQPTYARKFEVNVRDDEASGGKKSLVLSVTTQRTTPREKQSIEELANIDFVPDVSEIDIITNDIAGFPFPSICDFISEINRPPDPLTISNLAFNYQVADLKYDLGKLKKKKNPQGVVDSINCKLTRLQFWRNVLEKEYENEPDIFDRTSTWEEHVQKKLLSLYALKDDPKKILDTQYDRKKVFIKIIDEWSDRLKRSFKFQFQSSRKRVDRMTHILSSKWRNEVLNTTKIFSKVAFLDLEGPEFTPGSPPALFDNDRQAAWIRTYAADVALYEMVTWLKQSHLPLENEDSPYNPDFGTILQHTYSRGFVTECVMQDTWLGVARFLVKHGADSKFAPLNATETALSVSARSEAMKAREAAAKDHTDEFLMTLKNLNTVTRSSAMASGQNVKNMYKDLHYSGKDLVEWWTTLVVDLGLVEKVHDLCSEREDPWSEVIDKVMETDVNPDMVNLRCHDWKVTQEHAEENCGRWREEFKEVLALGEKLDALMPWQSLGDEFYTETELDALEKKVEFRHETLHVDFIDETGGQAAKSMLVVAPRFFRYGVDEELSAFLEYSQMVSQAIKEVCSPMGIDATVIPLHPRMINQNGIPDYGRRAPHPALVIRIN